MTISKNIKTKQRILDSLKDQADLSTNKGKVIPTLSGLSRKDRKHSGRYTPIVFKKGKMSEMVANADEPKDEYDDWSNYRDSFRDRTKITNPNLFGDEEDKKMARERNKKIKKHLVIRKAKQKVKQLK